MTGLALVTKSEVGIQLAQALLDAARAKAEQMGLAISAAVVDCGGQLVAAIRMDGAQICAMPLAIDKAYTAVACGMPTSAWADRTQPGGRDWGLNTALGGRLIAFAGGRPLHADSSLIGAIGVSGAAAAQDEVIVNAAVESAGLG
jgi:uncharacterized protein GlcG (DUF336 family)